jgi:branched-chain amino acid transport system substrate-binding protein
MEEPIGRSGEPQVGASGLRSAASGSPTRGFLFADLRDYTRYLEGHGAADAAELLVRYRTLVRQAVTEHDGAEIKTEGDSFYVVFPAVSAAVLCGLAIVETAGGTVGPEGQAVPAIPVGIGIHAGETVETPDGYVGTAVNIAARICAIAKPGEVLVSDTVRALTQTVLPVSFAARGRQKLKGVTDPVAVFAVARSGDAWAGTGRAGPRRRRLVAAGAMVCVLAMGVGLFAWTRLHPTNALPLGPWTIGTDFPISGDIQGRGIPIDNAIKLAIADANATGGVGGAQLTLDERDDAGQDASGADAQDPVKGVANLNAFIADPRVVAMIGPAASNLAKSEIPISNAAGLFQCSPANTSPGLTKPSFGALDLRSANPTRINYVRLATVDDIQGPAAASYAFRDLGARSALVIDDTQVFGREVADSFQKAFQALGGTAARRSVNADSVDLDSALGPLSTAGGGPSVVYFGGYTDSGAAAVRKAMFDRGFAKIPFISTDGIYDGTGSDEASFISRAGAAAAANSFITSPSIAPVRADFDQHYRDTYGSAPDEFAGAAYACTQVIIESLREVAKQGPGADDLRELVRAWAVDPSHRFDTVLGTLGFDLNGDSTQQIVTFYRVDPGAGDGKGDWVIAKQQDFGPEP